MNGLERMRLDARLSRRALGEKAGISHETIRRIEDGDVTVRVETAAKLADALSTDEKNVSPADLVAALQEAA